MPYHKQAKKCFSCQKGYCYYSRDALRIYIVCPDSKCFEKQFNLKPETIEG